MVLARQVLFAERERHQAEGALREEAKWIASRLSEDGRLSLPADEAQQTQRLEEVSHAILQASMSCGGVGGRKLTRRAVAGAEANEDWRASPER